MTSKSARAGVGRRTVVGVAAGSSLITTMELMVGPAAARRRAWAPCDLRSAVAVGGRSLGSYGSGRGIR